MAHRASDLAWLELALDGMLCIPNGEALEEERRWYELEGAERESMPLISLKLLEFEALLSKAGALSADASLPACPLAPAEPDLERRPVEASRDCERDLD